LKRSNLLLLVLILLVSGCSLAEDVTPPPELATAQAAQLQSTATSPPEQPEAQPTRAAVEPIKIPGGRPDLEAGAEIYLEKCAACHGLTGQGDGTLSGNLEIPPPALANPEISRQATLSDWYTVVTQGRMDRFMPGFASLNDLQRRDVAAFALSLGIQPENLALGAEIFKDECAICHREDGRGGEGVPSILDIQVMADRSALDMYTTIVEGASGMPAYRGTLVEEQLWAVVHYVQQSAFAEPVEQDEVADDPTSEPSLGAIAGQVMNATEGGIIPPGLEITLLAVDEQVVVSSITQTVAEDGVFGFKDLSAVPELIYYVFTEYQDVRYISEGVHILQGETSVGPPLIIYETTDNVGALGVERLHIIFNVIAEELLEVTEVWVLTSSGDRTVVSSGGEGAVRVILPEDYGNLRFPDADLTQARFQMNEGGFSDHTPIIPGEPAELVFTFTVPFENRLDFTQEMTLPVGAIVMLTAENGPTLEADGLQDMGIVNMGSFRTHNYALDSIAAGDTLRVRLRSGEAASIGDLISGPELAIGIGILGGTLVLIGWWWYRRSADSEEIELDAEVTVKDHTILLEMIAALDDDFEAGKISEEEYYPRRASLKQEALTMMRDEHD
jgi:mono/diheme cytochrome c family protein